jgi:anti-sigma B factor antagonist
VNLTFSKVGDVGIIRVDASRIDAAVAIQFKDLFSQIVIQMGIDADESSAAETERSVLLDVSEVEFLDSSGLGAVVAARKLLGQGHHLALSGLQPAVEKVLRLTHMDRVFPIYPDAGAFLTAVCGGERA